MLEAIDTWDFVDHTEIMNVIQSTWAFELKKVCDEIIKELKAWFVSEKISR